MSEYRMPLTKTNTFDLLAAALEDVGEKKLPITMHELVELAVQRIRSAPSMVVPMIADAKAHLLRQVMNGTVAYLPEGMRHAAEAYEALVRAEVLEREGRTAGVVRDLETGAPTGVAIRRASPDPLEVDPDSDFARAARREVIAKAVDDVREMFAPDALPPEAACRNCGCMPGEVMRGAPAGQMCVICGARGSGPEAA